MRVYIYTSNDPEFKSSLRRSGERGADVKILASTARVHSSDSMKHYLESLLSSGIQIRLLDKPAIHSKTLLTEKSMIVGSANYTVESQKLVETSVLFDINNNTWQEEERKFQALWAKGVDLAASAARPPRAQPSASSGLGHLPVSEPIDDPMSTPVKHQFSPDKSQSTVQAHDRSPTASQNHTTAVRSRAKGKKVDTRRQLFPSDD